MLPSPYIIVLGSSAFDAHPVERTVDEEEGNDEEGGGENVRQAAALRGSQLHGKLDGEQAEESRELDDRIQRNGRCVFEWIANRVADDCGVVQRRPLLFQLDFNDFFGIVPGAAGVGHKNGLIQAEDGDGEKIADEEERFDESKRQRSEKHGNENVQHAFLRVLGANFNDLLAVGDAGGSGTFELDVGFDEFDRAVGSGGYSLRARAGEPVNHGATSDQAENKGRVKQRQVVDVFAQAFGERHDDRKNHRGGAYNCGADEHRLRRGLEGVARAVVGFQHFFGALEIDVDVVVLFQLSLDARNLFNQGELVHGLRVVRDGTVGIYCDGHWTHA